MAEMALMFADRAQAIAEVIQPALDAGKIVLCDRLPTPPRPTRAAAVNWAPRSC